MLFRVATAFCFGTTLAILGWAGLISCVTEPTQYSTGMEKRIVGKTKQDILACAGKPKTESEIDGMTVLTYLERSPLMERSAIASKNSRSTTAQHSCRAQLYLQNDRVI